MQDIEKVLERAAKLLALQEHRGATEAEASLAAEHLQRLLQDHNLSLSQVEQHASNGEAPVSKRIKDAVATAIYQPWRKTLLAGVATNNFCLAHTKKLYGGERVAEQSIVIGREVNVRATKMTYDYLLDAFTRVAKEKYGVRKVDNRRDWAYFMDGAVSRVIERLNERRKEREAEDTARAQNATGNGTHKELVLADVYGSEADLNNDMLNGYPPGTTAQERRTYQKQKAEQKAEHDRLVAEGVDSTVAWYRAYGYSEERAVEFAKGWKRQSRRGGRSRHRATNWSRRDEAEYRKVNSASYKSGRETGSSVGLDSQVGGGNRRRIG